jgi:hypothetical protein
MENEEPGIRKAEPANERHHGEKHDIDRFPFRVRRSSFSISFDAITG